MHLTKDIAPDTSDKRKTNLLVLFSIRDVSCPPLVFLIQLGLPYFVCFLQKLNEKGT